MFLASIFFDSISRNSLSWRIMPTGWAGCTWLSRRRAGRSAGTLSGISGSLSIVILLLRRGSLSSLMRGLSGWFGSGVMRSTSASAFWGIGWSVTSFSTGGPESGGCRSSRVMTPLMGWCGRPMPVVLVCSGHEAWRFAGHIEGAPWGWLVRDCCLLGSVVEEMLRAAIRWHLHAVATTGMAGTATIVGVAVVSATSAICSR